MTNIVRNGRLILLFLGILPSVIDNLSANNGKDNIYKSAPRILSSDEYQIEKPLIDGDHPRELISNGHVVSSEYERLQQTNDVLPYKPRYSGVGFVTKSNFNKTKIAAGDRNTHPLSKKFASPGHKGRILLNNHIEDDDAAATDVKSDLRSGSYFDGNGDWFHNAHHGSNIGGVWTNELAFDNGIGSDNHNLPAAIGQSHGHALLGVHLLNPFILVAMLSFVISLMNALLGIVDKFRLPVVRARGVSNVSTPKYSRAINKKVPSELDDLIPILWKRHNE
ncbi:uncharacterized protein LOC129764282 [Toxorhynchites rutilus septentrionalis]|uniref:uncharacterized protein LOC129764282 n=1 Tax=Toxorhynchites rutilus septentrionalis TaxID=329112 RepID=UPI00247880AE|nr:uncharacterized protein LOC129764282 [Toxorhynchites rutilus septentrionalis]XP_055619176.1 uncharacterized protein LOC129764282 [Toxorhynchites rutilus septentrionalis]